MPLFGGGGQQNRSLNDVEQEIRGVDMGRGAFTSDLSGQEFWLVRDQGYVPLALVMGNSVFSMGIVGGLATALRGLGRGELTEYTQLMYDARQLALSRMKHEADQLGADGIVGVDFQVIHHGTDVMEVWAVGTAVKYAGQPEGQGSGSRAQVVLPVGGQAPAPTAAYVAPAPPGGVQASAAAPGPGAALGGLLGGIIGQVAGGDMRNL
jgi:uncharacterized protein YbjQ (UPF0145 family)